MSIALRNIHKSFGAYPALSDVSLDVHAGELVALLGPSGSGKTTLLRIIAGLESPDPGVAGRPEPEVRFDGRSIIGTSVSGRGVGFVFQHYALFRHMSVCENIAFGLRVRPRKARPAEADIRARVRELLGLVQLEGLAQRMPHELSGGQRQRVALARALAVEPRVLLLDEPFGALDARVRADLRAWLRSLHAKMKVTTILVTHDQEEALEVADRVVVLNKGRIEQIGPPADVYHAPATPFVCTFLGRVNIFSHRATLGEPAADGAGPPAGLRYVRPHEMDIMTDGLDADNDRMHGTITHVNAAGPVVRVELRTDDLERVMVDLTHERFRMLGVARGDRVLVAPRDARVFQDGAGI